MQIVPELLRINQTILLTIKRLGINGEGIGYYKKKAVFVKGLIPPEEALVRITKVKPSFAEGEIVRIRIKAAKRVKPFCKHFFQCGGCQIQHIAYDEQLALKEEMLEQTLLRYTKLTKKEYNLLDIEEMEEPLHYRYKSQLPVKNTKNGIISGLFSEGTNNLIPIKTCDVHTKKINDLNTAILAICDQYDIRAFDPKTMRGMLRYIVIRESYTTHEFQVTLVITIYNKALQNVAKEIMKLPNVINVSISKNHDKRNYEIFGKEVELLQGTPYLKEQIENITYELKNKAFYQLNPQQAIKMYQYIKTLLNKETDKLVIDAYSGAGAIALYIADSVDKVIGIDTNEESIYSALHNKKKNNINNVDFIKGKTGKVLYDLKTKNVQPTTLIVDPPRSGLEEETITYLLKNPIQKLIYISCNPSTLAKNIAKLNKKYNLISIKPYDMFPQTSHIESVAVMEKKQ